MLGVMMDVLVQMLERHFGFFHWASLNCIARGEKHFVLLSVGRAR